MRARLIGFLVLSSLVVRQADAQAVSAQPAVGDHLVVEMSEELARAYADRVGLSKKTPPGMSISTTDTVEQRLANGTYRIGHQMPVKSSGMPRLLTLTAVVDPAQISAETIAANTPVYASPAAHQAGGPSMTTKFDQANFRLKLSDLKDVKLQTWELVDEIGQ